MKKMFLLKKISALLVVCLCFTISSPVHAFAQTNDKNTSGRVDAPLTVARPSQNPDMRLSRIRLFTKLIIHNHLS